MGWSWCIPSFWKVSYIDLSGIYQRRVADILCQQIQEKNLHLSPFEFLVEEPLQLPFGVEPTPSHIMFVTNIMPAIAHALEKLGNTRPYTLTHASSTCLRVAFIQHPLPPSQPVVELPQTSSPPERPEPQPEVLSSEPAEGSQEPPTENTPASVPTPTTPSPRLSPLTVSFSQDHPTQESTAAPETISVEVSQASVPPSD